jgi:hypothetical protein
VRRDGVAPKSISSAAQFSKGKEGVQDFRAALEPLRQTLKEVAYIGGNEGPSYADMFVFGFFMVCHQPCCVG